MACRFWIGCLQLGGDVPAWALGRPQVSSSQNEHDDVQDPFVVIENGEVVGRSSTPQKEGVELGMNVRRARSLCPEASTHVRDPALEEAVWDQALREINRISPRIESDTPGLAWFEPIEDSALRAWLQNRPFQCGVGRCRSVARLAAWKAAPGRLLCIPEEHEDNFLGHIPTEALQEIGCGGELVERLTLFGYSSVGACRTLSKHHLGAQFGAEGERLAAFLARESERVSYYTPPPSMGQTREFEHPVEEPGPLKTAIAEVSDAIADRLQGAAFQRATLSLKGRDEDETTSRVVEPRTEAGELKRVGFALLDVLLSDALCVQVLCLSVGGLHTLDQEQGTLFRNPPERRRAIAAAERRHPGALLRVTRDPEAVFEEERFAYKRVSTSR